MYQKEEIIKLRKYINEAKRADNILGYDNLILALVVNFLIPEKLTDELRETIEYWKLSPFDTSLEIDTPITNVIRNSQSYTLNN